MQTFSNPSTLARGGPLAQGRRGTGLVVLGCALLLGACAQTDSSRMGGPGDSPGTGASEPAGADRERSRLERPRTAPGDVNQSDTNLERAGQPATGVHKSGPPSTAMPGQ